MVKNLWFDLSLSTMQFELAWFKYTAGRSFYNKVGIIFSTKKLI